MAVMAAAASPMGLAFSTAANFCQASLAAATFKVSNAVADFSRSVAAYLALYSPMTIVSHAACALDTTVAAMVAIL